MADVVTKIQYNRIVDNNQIQEAQFDIGVNAENVFMTDNTDINDVKKYNLQNLFNYLKNFFTNGHFIVQSINEPDNENVVIWNQIPSPNQNS